MSLVRFLRRSAIPSLGLLLVAPPASAGDLTVEGSLSYATGDYGLGETTRSWTLLDELSYSAGSWSLLVSLPVYRQSTSDLLHAGPIHLPRGPGVGTGDGTHPPGHPGGPGPSPGPAATGDKTGMGDPVLRVDFALPGYLPGGIAGGLFVAVKAPVADADRGFGTERWDYGAGMVGWRSSPKVSASLELGWWRLGDSPALELKDPFTYHLALARPLGRGRFTAAGFVRGRTETIAGQGSSVEAGVTLNRSFGSVRSLGVSVLAGLTEAGPDLTVALGWRFGRRLGWRVERP